MSNVVRVKSRVLDEKHWINDPFGHKLQITLINVTNRLRVIKRLTLRVEHLTLRVVK